MKFTIYCVGKLKEAYLRAGVEEFSKRLRPYGGVQVREIAESKVGDKPKEAQRRAAVDEEGDRILKLIKPDAYVVLLDVYGKTMSSEALAAHIAQLEVQGVSEMICIIGGAFGVSEALRKRANVKLSMSPMTFTHQMIRLLLVEQLYRACKINKNEPYHW